MKNKFFTIILSLLVILVSAQENKVNDKVHYKESKDGFYQNTILKGINDFNSADKSPKRYLSLDFSSKTFPVDINQYTQIWHTAPHSQGRTGTCWCFGATSFVESEIKRITGKEVELSEMYIVYWQYVERAKAFVKERGEVHFAEGSEVNAILAMMKEYGAVPRKVYSGLLKGQKFHDHKVMLNEMNSYLKHIKSTNSWDEGSVINNIKSILNTYLGEPPMSFNVGENEYTPLTYFQEYLKFNPNDYYNFMSSKAQTYNQKGELKVADNWWHCKDYYNIPLNDFISILKNSVGKGYSVAFCGDVSEPGYDRYAEVGIIPDFDIPADYINEDSREFRFNNKTTSDDHCMHVVGFQEVENEWWFLIKDSSSSGFDGPNKGYRFLHEDYFKLKILSLMVFKEGAKEVLDKIIK
jgi:bleomycin hydrolase